MLFESVNPIVSTTFITDETISMVQTSGGELWISTEADNPIQQLKIYSLSGNLIYNLSGKGNPILISTGDLPPGMYIFQFTTSLGSQFLKFLLH
jgi:hypothetical protein